MAAPISSWFLSKTFNLPVKLFLTNRVFVTRCCVDRTNHYCASYQHHTYLCKQRLQSSLGSQRHTSCILLQLKSNHCLLKNECQLYLLRSYSCSAPPSSSSKETNTGNPSAASPKPVLVRTRVLGWFIGKYTAYLAKFDAGFEQRLPKIYKVYKLFTNGVKEFIADCLIYYNVTSDMRAGKPLEAFSRKQLETYQQMPGDILHSSPVLITVPLPIAPYFIFPFAGFLESLYRFVNAFFPCCIVRLIVDNPLHNIRHGYMFPRQLLCRHFWTPQQRIEFALHDLQSRALYAPRILHYLEQHSAHIRDKGRRNVFENILSTVGSGSRVDINAVIDVRDLFITFPFGIDHLIHRHLLHVWNLCHHWDMSGQPRKTMKALQLRRSIDIATAREGITALNTEQLRLACFARGLDASGEVLDDDLRFFLTSWLQVTNSVDGSGLSLLLHCPFLISRTWWSTKKPLHAEQMLP